MSYDLYLLRVTPGKDALDEAKAIFSEDVEEINPGPPDSQKEATKKQLAKQLQLVNPALEVFPFDYTEIARFLKISEQEAQTQYRHMELNEADGGNGIQITLYDDTASLTIPYWHTGEKASKVWSEAWRYLGVLQSQGGFSIYDPQLEKMLSLNTDFEEVLKAYSSGVDFTEQAALEMAQPKKPWWKFW